MWGLMFGLHNSLVTMSMGVKSEIGLITQAVVVIGPMVEAAASIAGMVP